MDEYKIDKLAKVLTKQIDREIFDRKYAPVKEILKLVGAGVFLATAIAIPNFPRALKPFIKDGNEYEVWKRFNIPYLKRTIKRLEKQKLVEIDQEDNMQVIKITQEGKNKILKFALDELTIKKPRIWDQKWSLVSFDLPEKLAVKRKIFAEYLHVWGFYPIHKSVYLHAYPCLKEIDFLREYLEISEFVRLFLVEEIENDKLFKDFFGV
ncbi:hypothetical protein HYT02_02665 [Candidatus Gottesmanbacteria bacterium]|nr:hypothetical protein [Candidatus Gottesmanbacteria bacterium]